MDPVLIPRPPRNQYRGPLGICFFVNAKVLEGRCKEEGRAAALREAAATAARAAAAFATSAAASAATDADHMRE